MMATRKIEIKDLKFTLDEIDETKGSFRGYASIWDIVDTYGDVVIKGAFKRTLKDNKQFPLLWSHNLMEPIGIIEAKEDSRGLAVQGQLNVDVQRGREIRSLMRQGAVTGLSIGFQTVRDEQNKETGHRRLTEAKLWEISPCVFQACPGAIADEVKTEITEPGEDTENSNLISEVKDKLSNTEVIQLLEAWRLLIESSRQTI
jgi:HK97 family phage prohead protease